MRLEQAKNLAEQLMQEHGLIDWKFVWDSSKFWFGRCNHENKTIKLSGYLTYKNRETYVRNTILHEIAHALCGQGFGHTKVWKAKAMEVGCTPKRHYSEKVKR